MELVNFDKLAIGQRYKIGDKVYKKVAPLISKSEEDGTLLFDVRLYSIWKDKEPPMVYWPVE